MLRSFTCCQYLEQRATAAGLLAARLRKGALILDGVWRAGAGAVNDFDPQAVPQLSGAFGAAGRSAAHHYEAEYRLCLHSFVNSGTPLTSIAVRLRWFLRLVVSFVGQICRGKLFRWRLTA